MDPVLCGLLVLAGICLALVGFLIGRHAPSLPAQPSLGDRIKKRREFWKKRVKAALRRRSCAESIKDFKDAQTAFGIYSSSPYFNDLTKGKHSFLWMKALLLHARGNVAGDDPSEFGEDTWVEMSALKGIPTEDAKLLFIEYVKEIKIALWEEIER